MSRYLPRRLQHEADKSGRDRTKHNHPGQALILVTAHLTSLDAPNKRLGDGCPITPKIDEKRDGGAHV